MGSSRQGREVDSALAMAVGFSFFPEPQQTVLDIYNTKGAGSRMKNRANVLTSRWGKIRTWLTMSMVGNI